VPAIAVIPWRMRNAVLMVRGDAAMMDERQSGACKVVGACKFLNAKLRAFGGETALWGSWFGG
jgi:hypothetical protein